MDETDELTAYHECGHACVAVQLGARVTWLSISPDKDDGPARFGEATIVWPRGKYSAKEFQNKLVLVALAGPVAEMIYRGEPLHPGFIAEWAADWQTAWQAAEPIFADERKRLEFLEEATRHLHSQLSTDRAWAAVAALADNLLAHEQLDEEAILEALSYKFGN